MEHLVSIDQISNGQIDDLFFLAEHMQRGHQEAYRFRPREKVVANLFYEPSTRTAASFHVAAVRLGASVFTVDDVKFSSMAKGESLEDTVQVIGGYVDAIVLRHPDDDAAELAAKFSPVPVINAGCGAGEHPTQALLDLYTIRREQGPIYKLTVGLMGDLRHSRTVHSLVRLLRRHGARICLISPGELQLPLSMKSGSDISFSSLDACIDQLDVLYLTRVQWERMSENAQRLYNFKYGLEPEMLARASPSMIVMHPLPRTSELPREIDADPRARYFQQAKNGLYIRMALLRGMLA